MPRPVSDSTLRTQTLHQNLLDLNFICESPSLHHDRETSCRGIP